jgi:proline iminopeptidase
MYRNPNPIRFPSFAALSSHDSTIHFMQLISTALLLCLAATAVSQDLYVKTFGDPQNVPLVFLHGGPGYNCANFEATTASPLAAEGFFVIMYDRRGEGRSPADGAQYTFEQTFDDLNHILAGLNISRATLIGHSFGGIVATLYADAFPDRVESVILVSAPVALQESYRTILRRCREIYSDNADDTNLRYIGMLEHMDTASLQYSSYCFAHAMQNGFYAPSNPTAEAQQIYVTASTDTTLIRHVTQMTNAAPLGFWQNEQYTSIDLTPAIAELIKKNIPIYGLYGREDGLYSTEQISALEDLIGKGHLLYLDRCSHSVFIDQQRQFIDALKTWSGS